MKFAYAWTFAGARGQNASAAARKTNSGIAAPAGVPRTVPPNRQVHLPNRQVHLPRHACGVPHRTPPASRVWRTGPKPGRSTPRRPAKTPQPPPVMPPPSHKACLGNMDRAALIARCAPDCLRGPDWAASPQPACFCLLGGFTNWFEFLERRTAIRCATSAPGSPLRSSGRYPHPRRSAPARRRWRRTHRRN